MHLRLIKIDEFQFLTCIKHKVWGSKKARFKDWQVGDYLAFQVDKAIAGLAKVDEKPYVSKEVVWDNGLFPHRIPIKFLHVMLPENRLSILGEIREALVSVWGPSYGWGVLNQVFLPDIESKKTVNSIRSVKNDLKDIQKDLDHYLIEAKLQRDLLPEKKKSRLPIKPAKEVVVKEQEAPTHETETVKDEQVHSKAQYLLIQLGKITKCSVWIASNDKSKIYMAENLGSGCLDSLPNLGLSEEATKRIKLIDVIWLHQKAPICAFEVEATTSIYSGLLRLSDLISVIPAINIKLFIVAPQEKQTKVMAELSRPTFQKIGLSDYCRQELENLFDKRRRWEAYYKHPTFCAR